MSSYLDYFDRPTDVLAFRGAARSGSKRLSMSLADDDNGGELCTGMQMLVQDWLLEFLKTSGSAQYMPESGSDFMRLARQGRLRTETDVFQFFNLTQGAIRSNLLKTELPTDPDDQRFSGARLERVTIAANRLSLYIRIVSRAGNSRRVILPIPIVV